MKKIFGLFSKIYNFYRHDCCVPYAISYYLVLAIYFLDFCVYQEPVIWPSAFGYFILFAYYLYNVRLYKSQKLHKIDLGFFIGFLTTKITIWGILLVGLVIISCQ
ncbi:hypothetical protein IID04_06360 [PVC group bacterium]|nr:hypothetical protein [PVC group bacterium]